MSRDANTVAATKDAYRLNGATHVGGPKAAATAPGPVQNPISQEGIPTHMVTNMQVPKRLTLWAEPVELPTADIATVVVGGGDDTRGSGEFALLAIELPGISVSAHLDAGQLTSVIAALVDIREALEPTTGVPSPTTIQHSELVTQLQQVPGTSTASETGR